MLFLRKDDNNSIKQENKVRKFHGNGFIIDQPEGWQDKTIYTLVGPVSDNIQHNIIVMIDENVPFDSITQYADMQVTALEDELKGFLLLKREDLNLPSGYPAHKIIFRWFPTDNYRIYQEQLFIMVGKTVYKLITSFSKKTRKTIGPEIDRILLSFQPDNL